MLRLCDHPTPVDECHARRVCVQPLVVLRGHGVQLLAFPITNRSRFDLVAIDPLPVLNRLLPITNRASHRCIGNEIGSQRKPIRKHTRQIRVALRNECHALRVNLEPVHCNLLDALELDRLDLMALASIHDLFPQTLELELQSGDLVCEILRDVFVVGCHKERDGIVRCGSVHVRRSLCH